MKVAIIGAGGRVGCCTAYALQLGGVVSEIILSDIAEDLVQGETLDLLHGSSLCHDQRIWLGNENDAAQADMVIITAGLRRKPGESRLDLISRNVSLFSSIVTNLANGGLRKDSILVVVSNPVDILTYIATSLSGLPPERVIGLGTLLDTARFCSFIADAIKAAPTQVAAMILGEHGDSMVPIWSSASYAGFPIENHPELPASVKNRIFERTRKSGAEVISLKGGAGWAVATSIATLAHSIALDQRKLLPVSSLQRGTYGITDICLSVPTLVGRAGIVEQVEMELWPKELQGLKKSASLLMATLKEI